MRLNIPYKIKTVIATTIGAIIYAAGLNMFIIPHHLLAGGLTGIAVIIYYLIGFPPGIINIVLNIPILIIAYRWLGRWSVAIAIYGATISSLSIDYLKFLNAYHMTQNSLVGSMGGGIICGLGLGLIYRYGGTGGGIDPLGQIARKYWGVQIASVSFALNVIILTISSFVFNVEIALITLLSLYICANLSNKVVLGFQQQKAAFVVSYKADEIGQHIMSDLGRGVTLLHGEGAFTKESKKVVLAVIGLMQVVKLKNVVSEVDPHAFLLITEATDVTGGFIKRKIPAPVLEAMEAKIEEELEESSLVKIEEEKNSFDKVSL